MIFKFIYVTYNKMIMKETEKEKAGRSLLLYDQ